MKVLLLTVAGASTRFSQSIGKDCLKCLYYVNDFSESLLYKAVKKAAQFDKIVIVGGYKYEQLEKAVNSVFADMRDKIILLQNPFYLKYGSGYSLYVGLKYLYETGFDELVFAEGDLWIDGRSFKKIAASAKDAVTYNNQVIFSDKAVVFYFDVNNRVHYLYDTSHKYLEINQPFVSIYNSAQIWKFTSYNRFKQIYVSLRAEDWQTTNLVFIQKYFGGDYSDFSLIEINKWVNCNTIEDFYKIGGK